MIDMLNDQNKPLVPEKSNENEYFSTPSAHRMVKYEKLKEGLLKAEPDTYLRVDCQTVKTRQSVHKRISTWGRKQNLNLGFRSDGQVLFIWKRAF